MMYHPFRRPFILLAALLPVLLQAAEVTPARFAWQQPIEGELNRGGLYRLEAPAALFDGSHDFPRDLRIFDKAGQLWPCYIWTPKAHSRFQALHTKKLNQLQMEDDDPHLLLELQVTHPSDNAKRARHNQIKIETGGSDFIRRVEVFASRDRKQWGRLGEGFLIDHRKPATVRNSIIRYPDSDLPYLQLRVYPNARKAGEQVSLQSLQVGRNIKQPGQWVQRSVTLTESEVKPPPGATTYGFSLTEKHVPIERIEINTADPEYARPVRLYARNGPDDDWHLIHWGEIHRLNGEENNRLTIHSRYRDFRLEVFHHDDAPLRDLTLTCSAHPRYLVFEAQSGQPASLYYGAEQVRAPQHDLQRRRGDKEAAGAPEVKAGKRILNPLHKQTHPERYVPWITGGIIALVSLFLMWVIIGMMKKMTKKL